MTYCSTADSRTALLKISDCARSASRQVECSFEEMRDNRLSISCPIPVATCLAVSVEYEDALYLGEVMTVQSAGAQWHVEIRVEQILSGLNSLLALRNQLLSTSTVSPAILVEADTLQENIK